MNDIFEESQNGNLPEPKVEIPETETPLAEKPIEELKQLGVDDPKSFKYWNSKYDKEVTPLKAKLQELEQRLQEKDSKVNEFETFMNTIKNPPKKEEPLVEPNPPSSDDPIEQIDYLKKLSVYNKKLVEQQRAEFNQFKGVIDQERQAKEKALAEAQYKTFVAGKLQEHGKLKPEEALEAINLFGKAQSNADEYFGDLAEFYKFKKEKGLKTKIKSEQPDQPLPPGIESGTNIPTPDETQEFMGKMGRSDTSWVFQTK